MTYHPDYDATATYWGLSRRGLAAAIAIVAVLAVVAFVVLF